MAANKIIIKIEEDGAREAAEIVDAAKKKAAASTEKIKAAAKVKIDEINAQAAADADEAARRQTLIAELEARKNALDSKRKVLEEAFAKAEETINAMPDYKWEQFITSIVVKSAETGTEKICVPAADRAKYEGGFLARLNDALVKAGKQGKLTLSDEAAKFSGGILLQGKTSDFDGSFATIMRDVRTRIEKEVADMLFAAEVK
ncbi:MAG: V-type ATP synthase subunit E [Acidaminococcaceae bacterium]|nr:V-type ATP synthase subunit E [Acidaminococcaceae bacterium]